jgi:formylglycine-generating enzyme required for sulfatase activity
MVLGCGLVPSGPRVSTHEVRQDVYAQTMGTSPSWRDCPSCPVDSLTRAEAAAVCEALGARLPSVAELSAVSVGALSGPITRPMGTDPVAQVSAWYKANSGGSSHPVGQLRPSASGHLDVLGNVAEWTADDHDDGRALVFGGSWYHNAEHLRADAPLAVPADARLSWVGVRCVAR